MNPIDLEEMQSPALLSLQAAVMDELHRRGVLRTSNNPSGDLGEYLFCNAFGWKQAANSMANVDAVCAKGVRYQIKARRITTRNKSRQLSAIRDLEDSRFDFLAAVLFAADYAVVRAAIIPHEIVTNRADFVKRTNSHKFILRDDIWELSGVRDVTKELRAVRF